MHLVALRAKKEWAHLEKLEREHKSLIHLYHLRQEQIIELEIREMKLMEQVESLESSMKKLTRGEHKHKEMLFHHARDYGKKGLGSFPEVSKSKIHFPEVGPNFVKNVSSYCQHCQVTGHHARGALCLISLCLPYLRILLCGLMCTFDKYGVIVFHKKDKSLVFKGFRYRHVYLVDFSEKEASSMTCLFSKTSLGCLWHRRIAHIGMSNLKKAHKRGMITGLKDMTFDKNKLYNACQSGKQVVIHHPLKTMLSTSKPLELLHMDLFGPTSYKSIGGNLYCLVIIDDYSRYTWTLFLSDKSETPEIFKTFARRAQRKYNSPIVKIRSDNCSEFKNMNIEDWCDKEGVKHEFSATYTPQ
jgi:hypothetical protein